MRIYTFGEFNHELDYIIEQRSTSNIFSPECKINGRKVVTVSKEPKAAIKSTKEKRKSAFRKTVSIENYFGINNFENCCFLNATLQVLLKITGFCSVIRSYAKRDGPGSIVIELMSRYIDSIEPPEQTNINVEHADEILFLWTKVNTINPCLDLIPALGFIKNQHEDAEEFITKLLTQVHEDFLNCRFRSSTSSILSNNNNHIKEQNSCDEEWVEIGKGGKNLSPPRVDGGDMSSETGLSQLFAGKIVERLLKKKNRSQNSTSTPFFILPLNIHAEQIVDVSSAVISLICPERLADKLSTERQMLFGKLPPMLIVQLKRFTFTKGIGAQKIQKCVKINNEFSIPNECLTASIQSQQPPVYQLYAVVFHIGESVQKGHYTSAVRGDDENAGWVYFDDNKVFLVRGSKSLHWLLDSTEADIPAHLLSADLQTSCPRFTSFSGRRTPYLLFYCRM